jgi:hypothetical protein
LEGAGGGFPTILCKDLTVAETQNVAQKTKELGITINDWFLCTTFLAMKQWREQNFLTTPAPPKEGNYAPPLVGNYAPPLVENYSPPLEGAGGGYLRIAVPTNLRTTDDALMPAANIVSMVFLDRKPAKVQASPSFYRGVHREMQHIKRCDLGWAFIHGLTLYRRIFGSFRKMVQQNRCWATATVSNLGRWFADIPLPKREGRVQIDESLELRGVEASPPIRASTALGISVLTYADGMTVNLHYDSNALSRADAQTILDVCCGSAQNATAVNC